MAEQLEEALERCLQDVRAGLPVDVALARQGAARAAIEPLVRTALALHEGRQVTLREDRRRAMRRRLLQRAALPQPQAAGWGLRLRSWYTRAAATAAGLGLAGGVAISVASADAMPDSALYPVKLAKEQVQLAVTMDPAAKADLLLQLSEKRLNEANQMLARNETSQAAAAIQRYRRALDEGAVLALQAAPRDPRAVVVAGRLAQQASRHEAKEKEAMASAPSPQARAVLADAAQAASETKAKVASSSLPAVAAAVRSPTATLAGAVIPSATPTHTPTPTPTATHTTATPTHDAHAAVRTETATPSPTAQRSTPSPTPSPTATAAPTNTPSPSLTPTSRPSATPTATPQASATASPTPTRRPADATATAQAAATTAPAADALASATPTASVTITPGPLSLLATPTPPSGPVFSALDLSVSRR